MNWKSVLYLLRVERKSGRLLRGIKTTKYRERGIIAYWPYWVAAIIGVAGGLIANFAVAAIYSDTTAANLLPPLSVASLSFFVSMPTLILILSVVLTMLQQIQLAGMKATRVVNYWLPITWQEHTLASILANLLGLPIATVIAFASGIIVFSAFNGLIVSALLTSLALFGAAFMASATTEIVRVVQVRFTGAVYKSSGKAAVWVRFAGTLIFFLIFYIVYFMITQGTSQFIQGLAAAQNTVWFVPFVWLGVTLFYLLNGVVLQGVIFIALSAVFIAALYYLAISLNKRFGLYEPPAITVQAHGTVYAPKSGFLGKLGFSSVEAAIIRKDIRSFTRRRELISVFIVPIVFILVPIMQSFNLSSNSDVPSQVNVFFMGMVFLLPPAFMSMILGNMLIGEEGQSVWRIYASPISPKNLVKSKFFFQIIFSIIILFITGAVGIIIYHPSIKVILVAFLEGLFLIFALGTIGLVFGFKGADFTASRRARMIRQQWSLISLVVCFIAGVGVLAPVLPYMLNSFLPGFLVLIPTSNVNIAISLVISGVIASVVTAIFYKINLSSAAELIRKAET
jgi:hypothetical protein